ncbi:MAG: cysteine hydrolase [Chloroflexi bacterium]|nr:cysteine hydrolase [Chloroflexota bacterium]
MSYKALDPDKTALLFFDMLNQYHTNDEPLVLNCVRLREAADAHGIPVFFAMADHRPDGADAATLYTDTGYGLEPWPDPEHGAGGVRRAMVSGSKEIQVIDALAPKSEDYVIKKHRWSAFHQTSLELSLRTRGVDTIVLCGGSTRIGIGSTAYSARDLDFNLVIVRDCCSDSLEDTMAQYMERVFPVMARVRTADETIAMMDAGKAG